MNYKSYTIRADLIGGRFVASKDNVDVYSELTMEALKNRIDVNIKRDLAVSDGAKVFVIENRKVRKGRVTSLALNSEVWVSLENGNRPNERRKFGRWSFETLYLLSDQALAKAAGIIELQKQIDTLEKQCEKLKDSLPTYKIPKEQGAESA